MSLFSFFFFIFPFFTFLLIFFSSHPSLVALGRPRNDTLDNRTAAVHPGDNPGGAWIIQAQSAGVNSPSVFVSACRDSSLDRRASPLASSHRPRGTDLTLNARGFSFPPPPTTWTDVYIYTSHRWIIHRPGPPRKSPELLPGLDSSEISAFSRDATIFNARCYKCIFTYRYSPCYDK